MEQVLLVIQVLIAVALIAMVLIQRSDSDGFGLGGGGGGNLMSGRAAANLMTRTTAILAGLFIINSLALSVMAAHDRDPSIAEAIERSQAPEATKGPVVPLAGTEKAVKVEEKTGDAAAPKVPVDADDKPAAAKKPAALDAPKDEKTDAEAKPAAVVKKAKKPVVKPADATPIEADHNNE